jgi:hypothetical protein
VGRYNKKRKDRTKRFKVYKYFYVALRESPYKPMKSEHEVRVEEDMSLKEIVLMARKFGHFNELNLQRDTKAFSIETYITQCFRWFRVEPKVSKKKLERLTQKDLKWFYKLYNIMCDIRENQGGSKRERLSYVPVKAKT